MRGVFRLLLALAATLAAAAQGAESPPPTATATVNGTLVLRAEIAETPAARRRGLSGRRHLPAGGGMLFVFAAPRRACLWMKNTHIPLLAVFLDERREVIRTARMAPNSEELHCADGAKWALEMRDDAVDEVFSVRFFRDAE